MMLQMILHSVWFQLNIYRAYHEGIEGYWNSRNLERRKNTLGIQIVKILSKSITHIIAHSILKLNKRSRLVDKGIREVK